MPDGNAVPQGMNLRNLIYEIDGRCLLNIPSLLLNATGKTLIMGPNGAGKSLLLRVMHGLLKPSRGSVEIGGNPLSDAELQKQSFVFQKPVLLRRTTEANLHFVLRMRGFEPSNAAALLDAVSLTGKEKTPARKLSGGEQQRLSIAMALASKPQVLFLDEPTASLDPASAASVEQIIQTVSGNGIRVIAVTHDTRQAKRLADDVVLMNAGRVIEHAPAQSFFNGPETEEARAYLEGRNPI